MPEKTSVSASGSDAFDRAKRMLENSGIKKEDVIEVDVTVLHEGDSEDVEAPPPIGAPIKRPKPQRDGEPAVLSDEGEKVLNILVDHGGWLTPEEVADKADVDVHEAAEHLGSLCETFGEAIRRERSDGEYEFTVREERDEEIEYGEDAESYETMSEARRRASGGGGDTYKGSLPPTLFEGNAIRPDAQVGRVLYQVQEHDDHWVRAAQLDKVDELEDLDRQQISRALSKLFKRHGYVKRKKWEKNGGQYEYSPTTEGKQAIERGHKIAEEYYQRQAEEMEDSENSAT